METTIEGATMGLGADGFVVERAVDQSVHAENPTLASEGGEGSGLFGARGGECLGAFLARPRRHCFAT